MQRLHLSRNRISTLPIEGERLQRWSGLQMLILENNLVTTWSDIGHLAPLPSLARLSLCGNPVAGDPSRAHSSQRNRCVLTHVQTSRFLQRAGSLAFRRSGSANAASPGAFRRLLTIAGATASHSSLLLCQLVNCQHVEQLAKFEGFAVQVVPSCRVQHR